jgi:hypothetical protein
VSDSPTWRESRLKRLQVRAIAAVGYPLIALLARTLRLDVEGRAHLDALDASGRPFIVAFWHGRVLPLSLYFRDRGIVVITSENFDGEWIARIIGRLGYGTARGSSSRNARAATLQLVRDIRAGRSTAVTLDGPRGPARVAKPGAVWLAGATGAPLLPIHAECERNWELRSWDRAHVPKPFSRVCMAVGEPMTVPPGLSNEEQDQACRGLEAVLEALAARARELAGREA